MFQGTLFQENPTEKKTLIKQIELKSKNKIAKTQIIYAYDPKNPTNFHNYIDNVSGLTLIVKTTNGIIVAGYYSGNYNDKEILSDFSLLMSLTNEDGYVLLPDSLDNKGNKKISRGMVYDKFCAIYGNA